jgi:hypothetical protein
MEASRMQDVLTLIQMEYLEMPDLKLTLRQARRLFDLPMDLCEPAFDALVGVGFLARTRDGAFLRRAAAEPPVS